MPSWCGWRGDLTLTVAEQAEWLIKVLMQRLMRAPRSCGSSTACAGHRLAEATCNSVFQVSGSWRLVDRRVRRAVRVRVRACAQG